MCSQMDICFKKAVQEMDESIAASAEAWKYTNTFVIGWL